MRHHDFDAEKIVKSNYVNSLLQSLNIYMYISDCGALYICIIVELRCGCSSSSSLSCSVTLFKGMNGFLSEQPMKSYRIRSHMIRMFQDKGRWTWGNLHHQYLCTWTNHNTVICVKANMRNLASHGLFWFLRSSYTIRGRREGLCLWVKTISRLRVMPSGRRGWTSEAWVPPQEIHSRRCPWPRPRCCRTDTSWSRRPPSLGAACIVASEAWTTSAPATPSVASCSRLSASRSTSWGARTRPRFSSA